MRPSITAVRRAAAAVTVAVALLLGTWGLAHAHTALVSSDPAASARLAVSPARVRLVFNEPVEPGMSVVSIVGPGGAAVRLAAAGDPRDVNAVIAPVTRPLAPGSYRLRWRVVSADGHPVDGSFAFAVGDAAALAAAPTHSVIDPVAQHAADTTAIAAPADPPGAERASHAAGPLGGAPLGASALRGLALAALAGLVGLLACARLVRASGSPSPAPRRPLRIARWLAVAAPLLLAAHAGAWLLHTAPDGRLTGAWASAALASGVGQVELWRVGFAALAAWALLLARRAGLALVLAAAALLVSGHTGHSAALFPVWTTPAKALHLLASAVWASALLWFLSRERDDAAAYARETRRLSDAALVAIVVVTASGVVQSLLFLPSPLDLFRSTYGYVALAKLAGLGALALFGAHHRYRVVPRLAGDAGDAPVAARFGVTLRRELAVMAVVTLLGGLLAYISPPTRAAAHVTSSHTVSP